MKSPSLFAILLTCNLYQEYDDDSKGEEEEEEQQEGEKKRQDLRGRLCKALKSLSPPPPRQTQQDGGGEEEENEQEDEDELQKLTRAHLDTFWKVNFSTEEIDLIMEQQDLLVNKNKENWSVLPRVVSSPSSSLTYSSETLIDAIFRNPALTAFTEEDQLHVNDWWQTQSHLLWQHRLTEAKKTEGKSETLHQETIHHSQALIDVFLQVKPKTTATATVWCRLMNRCMKSINTNVGQQHDVPFHLLCERVWELSRLVRTNTSAQWSAATVIAMGYPLPSRSQLDYQQLGSIFENISPYVKTDLAAYRFCSAILNLTRTNDPNLISQLSTVAVLRSLCDVAPFCKNVRESISRWFQVFFCLVQNDLVSQHHYNQQQQSNNNNSNKTFKERFAIYQNPTVKSAVQVVHENAGEEETKYHSIYKYVAQVLEWDL